MALTITWDEYNTVSETKADDITKITMGSTDASDFTEINFPIAAGTNSYGKYIQVDFANMVGEGVTQVQTARIYDATTTRATGETVTYEGLGPVSFATPSQTGLGDSVIPTSDPSSQNLALNDSDSGVLTADGPSNYARFQRTTTGSTPNGALANLTITVVYDVV